MTVAANHFANVSFAHFDFEDQFAPLLHLAHKHFFRSLNKLPDDVLEKALHWNLRSRDCSRILLSSFQNHARNGGAWPGTAPDPVIYTIQIEAEILAHFPRVVFSNRLNKLSVTRASFVSYNHTIKRSVLGSFSP
jgi:hypothetical protein